MEVFFPPYKYLPILLIFHTKSSYKFISFQYFSLLTPNFLLQNSICVKIQMVSSIEAGGSWTNVQSGQNLGNEENTPPPRDPVEPPPLMIESSLYLIVSDYEDQEFFNCMMSE
ncbi:unnamed protein product [Prunus armeniaca]